MTGWLSRRQIVALVGGILVTLVAAWLVSVALRADADVVHHKDLNDGGVWVTNSARAEFGRVNKPDSQLDAGVAADVSPGSDLNILQDGAAVIAEIGAGSQLRPIDPGSATISGEATALAAYKPATGNLVFVPDRADLRGGTIAKVDPASGKVWAQRVSSSSAVGSLSGLGSSAKPLLTVGGVAAVAVGVDGTVYAVSGDTGTVGTLRWNGAKFVKSSTTLPFTHVQAVDITAVGSRYVVLNPFSGKLYVQGSSAGIDAGNVDALKPTGEPAYAALQQPGPASSSVLVEGPTTMSVVGLSQDSSQQGGLVVSDQFQSRAGAPRIARPVLLGGCALAAWAGSGHDYYGQNCGQQADQKTVTLGLAAHGVRRAAGVAFRVNRGLVVLNDLDTGTIWDIDNRATKIDNWNAVIPPPSSTKKHDKKDTNLVSDRATQEPPKAHPDSEKVRAGRTSTLHVLDNDSAAAGQILAIAPGEVTAPTARDVSATVSGDGQSIEVNVPAHPSSNAFTFRYTVNNGTTARNSRSTATVTVSVVPGTVNSAPTLRAGTARIAGATYYSTPGGVLSVDASADWRDPENDPVILQSGGAQTTVDGTGRLTISAPQKVGRYSIPYQVIDGRGGVGRGHIALVVLGVTAAAVPPRTQSDVVRAVVGKPVQIDPLTNDIPGADPSQPDAVLTLAAAVRSQGTLSATTDLGTGVVTLTGTHLGTYVLTYAAQVGSASALGKIRVDVVPNPDRNLPPVAVPDNATVLGQLPTISDVLANDYSPRDDVLVTQRVVTGADWLDASVVQGRWVRAEATAPYQGRARHGVIDYTISDGAHRATGQLTVTQQPPPPSSAQPLVRDDQAVVRRGDAVTVPVLDNDSMADGIPLQLDPRSVKVISGGGLAFASGNLVRYVPPASRTKLVAPAVLQYGTYPQGLTDREVTGRVKLTITPPPSTANPDQPPVAQSFTASVTAGDAVTMTVPTTGVDPDGDSVSLAGLVGGSNGLGLTLGRVTSIGASTIRYQAYPNSSGTDLLHYSVKDRYGARSDAYIRIGVVPPSDPQPPVAVQDIVTAAPGRTVHVPVLANDLVAADDTVQVLPLSKSNSAAVAKEFTLGRDDLISAKAPANGTRRVVTYGISDGLFDPSRTTLEVVGQNHFVNPPVAKDDVAIFKPGARTAVVNVLANDTDLDGTQTQLRIVRVIGPGATIVAGKVRVSAQSQARTVPYVIADADNAEAVGLIYVPAGNNGLPYVLGKTISMKTDGTTTVNLAGYVADPQRKALRITSPDTLTTSPGADLTASATGRFAVRLTSGHGYVGPAALMVEVTDRATAGQRSAQTTYVSIPVQVGPRVPLLRCPSTYAVNLVAAGNARTVDVPTLCHVWYPDGTSAADYQFTASWAKAPAGVSLKQSGAGGSILTLAAQRTAPGVATTLRVGVKGSKQTFGVNVHVQALPPPPKKNAPVSNKPIPPKDPRLSAPMPSMRPASINGLRVGASQSVDLAQYLDSPLAKPVCRIVSVGKGRSGVSARASGCTLTVTAARTARGQSALNVVVTDAPDLAGRRAAGQVSVSILSKPTAPRGVQAVADRDKGGQALVSWGHPADDGGSSITSYLVSWSGGTLSCNATPCTVGGLSNGKGYRFRVQARNGVGLSPYSGTSNVATPDTKPLAVNGVAMSSRGDRVVRVTWPKPVNKGSAIVGYQVRVSDVGTHPGTRVVRATGRSAILSGLVNDAQYQISVQARNHLGYGDYGTAVTVQSAGTPARVGTPGVTTSTPTPSSDYATITVSWSATDPNGPPMTSYTVCENTRAEPARRIGTCTRTTKVSAGASLKAVYAVPYDGNSYSFSVTGVNGAGKVSAVSVSVSYVANGLPENPGRPAVSVTKDDTSVQVTPTFGSSHAAGYKYFSWRASNGQSGTWSCAQMNCQRRNQAYGRLPVGFGAVVAAKEAGAPTSLTFGVQGTQAIQVQGCTTASTCSAWSPPSATFQTYEAAQPPGIGTASVGSGANNRTLTYSWRPVWSGENPTTYQISGAGISTTTVGAGTTTFAHTYPSYSTSYSIQVRALTKHGGWSGPTTLKGTTGAAPTPVVYGTHQGPKHTNGPGYGDCAPGASGCPEVDFQIKNFPPGSHWLVFADDNNGGQPNSHVLTVNSTGDGFTWGGYILLAYGDDAWVATRLTGTDGTSGQYESARVPWPAAK